LDTVRRMIVVVPYDEDWPDRFRTLRDRYEAALAHVEIIGIEHVGSTSVPGLAAKPVIDVDIVVDREHVAEVIRALESIGYESMGEQGIADRWAMRAPEHSIRTNTYVIVVGSVALRNHLAVRDVLRADAQLRDEYGELKLRLAEELDDIDRYVEAKSPVLQRVLARAGLDADVLAEIEATNRDL
jgi:GrpB-like predicted nucleotidyltransferase (UPF0157 family)